MNTTYASGLIDKVSNFPSLPSVVSRVLAITADKDSSVENLLEVITLDPSLTASILKISNSAFFGQVRKVSTLKQAISVLGMTEIQNVVVAKAVFNNFKTLNGGGDYIGGMRAFWTHSFICGLSAKILSSQSGLAPEDLFISGLIHDIGKLVIHMTLPGEYLKILDSHDTNPCRFFKSEHQVLGVSHDEIGLILLKRWMFPENLVKAVGFHHTPRKAGYDIGFPAVIHLADLLAHADHYGPAMEMDPSFKNLLFHEKTIDIAASVNINWDESCLNKYLSDLENIKEGAKETFELLLS